MKNYTVKVFNENLEVCIYTVKDATSKDNALTRALRQYNFCNDAKVTRTEVIEGIF